MTALRLPALAAAALLCVCAVRAEACAGRFLNPITDVCWDCIFPISIGSTKLLGSRPDTDNPSSPICSCPAPPPAPIRVGIAVGFWEPARLVDVTRDPGCFVNLGGLDLGSSLPAGRGSTHRRESGGRGSMWQAHWYVYPLLAWLGIVSDVACLSESGFDIAYITELDPLWQDDELTFLINPEAVLFGNAIAQAACAADCVAAAAGRPLDALFWCAGCQGGMYPLDGRVQAHVGGTQASLLIAERFAYKLHREFVARGTAGPAALCQPYPMPVMRKSQYRAQMTQPIPATHGPLACPPPGASTVLYEAGREFPVRGEDFGWLFWRKRNCCAF